MAKKNISIIFLLLSSVSAFSQSDDLLEFERKIEKSVVETNIPFLEKAYADDFRFKHGTGLVDSKASWLKSVLNAKGKYISRFLDSVEVEIHDKIGITNGKITVTRKTDAADKKYMIKYVRVYVRKKDQWELISHRTVYEIDYK
ncbi:hypothetical protein BH09BAC3_BH09BAC3_08810 [soil metagenome]